MQLALTRVEAVTLASALLEEGFLRTVGLKSMEGVRTAGLSEQFMDDSTALYSFVSGTEFETVNTMLYTCYVSSMSFPVPNIMFNHRLKI